jgi:hypothetical protein
MEMIMYKFVTGIVIAIAGGGAAMLRAFSVYVKY